jgi:hypothetical protein
MTVYVFDVDPGLHHGHDCGGTQMIGDMMDEVGGGIACAVLLALIPFMMLWIVFDDYVLNPTPKEEHK